MLKAKRLHVKYVSYRFVLLLKNWLNWISTIREKPQKCTFWEKVPESLKTDYFNISWLLFTILLLNRDISINYLGIAVSKYLNLEIFKVEITHEVTMNFSTFKKKFIVLKMVPFSLIFLDIFSLKYYHFLKQEIFEQFFGCM